MYPPPTRLQWLVSVALVLTLCWVAVTVLGVPWVHLIPGLATLLTSGWVSYAHYIESSGRPMFSKGGRQRSAPGLSQPKTRATPGSRSQKLITNPNARLSTGKGQIPKSGTNVQPRRSPQVPDAVPIKPPPPPRPAWCKPPAPQPGDDRQASQRDHESTKLFTELDHLTHDRKLSDRLVWFARGGHPDKSLNWCIRKAIDDLVRDRR